MCEHLFLHNKCVPLTPLQIVSIYACNYLECCMHKEWLGHNNAKSINICHHIHCISLLILLKSRLWLKQFLKVCIRYSVLVLKWIVIFYYWVSTECLWTESNVWQRNNFMHFTKLGSLLCFGVHNLICLSWSIFFCINMM